MQQHAAAGNAEAPAALAATASAAAATAATALTEAAAAARAAGCILANLKLTRFAYEGKRISF